jgi:hypothetical protein
MDRHLLGIIGTNKERGEMPRTTPVTRRPKAARGRRLGIRPLHLPLDNTYTRFCDQRFVDGSDLRNASLATDHAEELPSVEMQNIEQLQVVGFEECVTSGTVTSETATVTSETVTSETATVTSGTLTSETSETATVTSETVTSETATVTSGTLTSETVTSETATITSGTATSDPAPVPSGTATSEPASINYGTATSEPAGSFVDVGVECEVLPSVEMQNIEQLQVVGFEEVPYIERVDTASVTSETATVTSETTISEQASVTSVTATSETATVTSGTVTSETATVTSGTATSDPATVTSRLGRQQLFSHPHLESLILEPLILDQAWVV